MSCIQELLLMDHKKCVWFCLWIKDFLTQNPGILDVTFFTDEAWFHLSRYVNSRNTHIWAAENPHTVHEEPLHSQKFEVWCGISRRGIIGPIFFFWTDSYHGSLPANIQRVCQSINRWWTNYWVLPTRQCNMSHCKCQHARNWNFFLKTELSQKTFGHPHLVI